MTEIDRFYKRGPTKIPGDSTYRVHPRIREPGALPQPAPRPTSRPVGVLLRLLRGDRQLDSGSKHPRGKRAATTIPRTHGGGAIAAGTTAGATRCVSGSNRRGTAQTTFATHWQTFTGISKKRFLATFYVFYDSDRRIASQKEGHVALRAADTTSLLTKRSKGWLLWKNGL